MANLMVITGHGRVADGVKSFMELVVGKLTNVETVNFLAGDSNQDLNVKYREIIEKHQDQDIVFACDIVGGSPFNEAVKCAHENPKAEVLGGFSPAGILAGYMAMEYSDIYGLVETIVSSTRTGCMKFELKGAGSEACDGLEGI